MVVRGADLPSPSPKRLERIAAVGRLVFTAFTFVALSVDPTLPARNAQLTYVLLVGYVLYAAVFAAYAFVRTPGPRAGLTTHLLDLVLITVFQYLTAWMTSPFFVYFTFALVVATMRWQWRGVLWTALFALVAFNALGAYATLVLHDPVFELNRFLIRNFYLIVTASLLGYLGYIEHELRAELGRRMKKAAADAERVRLSRDLHDGVLQTLTGTALQLQTAERLIDRDPAEARAVLGAEVAAAERALRLRSSALAIRDQRTRWGSCSTRGTLSFSWRLVLAPPVVARYVACHEVAHLAEPNHGEGFWRLVDACCPDWRASRLWLRRHGHTLAL
jgi:predicted metal-dependent hydrolase